MKNRKASIILCLCTAIISALITISKVQAASPDVVRIYGSDRYGTNLSIVKKGWTQAPIVVICNGENYPDALCAAPLAKSKNAPIVLTTKEELSSSALEELSKLKTSTAFIIGGTGVVSTKIEDQLKKLGISYTRLAGANRYETSVKIAEQLSTENGVAVASGENFPDALSIAPIAAKMGMPILLSQKDSLPKEVNSYLQNKSVPVSYVIGGLGVLSSDVKSALKNPKRLNGMDRYETNISILKEFKNTLDFTSTFVASAKNFPDALSGSVLAANYNGPIVLTDSDLSQATSDFVKSQNCKVINILGGTGAVSSNAETNLKDKIEYSKIIRLDNTSDIAFVNEDYHFPTTVLATFEDSSTKLVPVKWNSSKVDTSKASSYKFEGTVFGYDGKVQLSLEVVEDADSSKHGLGNGTGLAYYKGYLYYSNLKDSKIYRIKSDGTENTKVSDDLTADLNITRDHIYYMNASDYGNIYRMNLDGSDRRIIINDHVSAFAVVGSYIYYGYYYQGASGFYRTNIDGSNKIKLSNDSPNSISIVDNIIYYSNKSDNDSIYKMNIDGSERTKLCSDSTYKFDIEDGWIYYAQADGTFTENGPGYKIYKIRTDGTERTKLSDDFPGGLWVSNGWIYYCSIFDGEKLYKIRLDGSNKTKITDVRSRIISVMGDAILFQAMDDNSNNYLVMIDGTLTSRFMPNIIDEEENNNTLSSAPELNPSFGFGDSPTIRGNLKNSDVDIFNITADSPAYLSVVFSSPAIGGNAVVTLMDINGKELYSTKTSYNGIAAFKVEMNGHATCYVKVSSPHGELIESGAYEMTAWFTSIWGN